ncbi:redox-regulated ATPase YchF [bacterium]|nr:redox-regulated ATPase YchF [bacterium]
MLKVGIVGLPNVGKSTLFNALTSAKNAQSANYPFCTIEPNVGVVNVPDERLWKLKPLVHTDTVIETAIQFVDIAGLVKGASKGEGLGNQFLHNIREVDAIVQVVRCFDDVNTIHVAGKVNPVDDIETINTELALADIATLENISKRISKQVKAKDKEAILQDSVIQKCMPYLEQGKFIDTSDFTPDEKQALYFFHLLMSKPVIYCANVSEYDLKEGNNYTKMVEEYAKDKAGVVLICARLEEELIDLGADEAKTYLSELGIQNSGIERMIKSAYDILNLRTYITAGEKEVKAWTITKGMKAPQAAGVIHTDFEIGFIKAEVVSYDDFISAGSWAAAREKGLARLEGKDYIVQDGDIMVFRFSN